MAFIFLFYGKLLTSLPPCFYMISSESLAHPRRQSGACWEGHLVLSSHRDPAASGWVPPDLPRGREHTRSLFSELPARGSQALTPEHRTSARSALQGKAHCVYSSVSPAAAPSVPMLSTPSWCITNPAACLIQKTQPG